MLHLNEIRREFKPMLLLAVPLVLTELSWLMMGFVDTIMVGHLPNSAAAIGAVSLGTTLFYTIGIFGSSIMLGLDTLVSQAYGARRLEECHRNLFNALYFALALSPAMMLVLFVGMPLLDHFGIESSVLALTKPFIRALNWSTLPLTLYFVLRRYLQSMDIVKPAVFTLISANLLNLLGNWTFVYGHFGFPALGVIGSGWSTCISRVYMVVVLAVAAVYYDRKRSSGLWKAPRQLELDRIRTLLRYGLPAALQFLLEISAFTAATVLIARVGAVALAGHQIALNVASLTYMVPTGISSAAAVRVGQAVGARDIHGASRAGWTALLFGVGFMSCSALVLFFFPEAIARIYSSQLGVIRAGATLLMVAAVFQLFDGTQVVVTGALRGAGNTHTPMLAHFFGYWLVGVPLGAFLCFKMKMGPVGFWTGLCAALVLIGSLLLVVWYRFTRHSAMEARQMMGV
ncbi:MAG TPA: MATE family efflux transporter [Candidatus Angelobacter sp.]|nr:MATE family efflux transporter [Candidatus Angelobacter sp.]